MDHGLEEGHWLRAGRQIGGRGRLGRRWESPVGNLYCSTIVRLRPHDPPPHSLALVTANAVHALIAPLCDGQCRIKWPNDILVDNAKISGMLLERSGDAVVIGVGLNVIDLSIDLGRAITNLSAQGASVTLEELMQRFASVFAQWLDIWREKGLAAVRTHWLLNAHPRNTPIRVTQSDGSTVDGLFETLDNNGMLVLQLADGGLRTIHAGDVHLL